MISGRLFRPKVILILLYGFSQLAVRKDGIFHEKVVEPQNVVEKCYGKTQINKSHENRKVFNILNFESENQNI